MRLRVRFAETDQMGVAHHAAYVVWLEAARVEWLRERHLEYRALEGGGVSLAVRSAALTYRSAVQFDDVVDVETRMVALRSRGCAFDYRLRAEDGRLVATATTEHVATGRDGRAVRIPDAWRERLETLVQGPFPD